MFNEPLNPLPPKCAKCGFPDLDHVPQPYFVVKSRTMSPNEMAPAENGNFFVRERIRRVLDLLIPGQCRFYPTCYKGTLEITPWLLAVPNHQVVTAVVDPFIPRCELCGEPQSAHPGTQYIEWLFHPQPCGRNCTAESEFDVLKASTWGSSEKGWGQWISRNRYMTVRLFHLLKKLKAKGLYEATCGVPIPPEEAEKAWADKQLQIIQQNGIALHPPGTLSDSDASWFREYLKNHASKAGSEYDIKAIEKRLKVKLPKSYVDFINKVGPTSFENLDEQKGLTVHVLSPHDLDCQTYRAGKLHADDEETNAVDGIMFAESVHGDCFCFDRQNGNLEYSVVLYTHECKCFEPFAENFAACIKRFAGGGDG